MSLTSDPAIWVGHETGDETYQIDRYHICASGHFWPAEVSAVTIYRMLGTTAAGKTMLLRNMGLQTVPGIKFVTAPQLCNRPFGNESHTPATVSSARTHRLHLTDFLGLYGATADELTELLTRSGFTSKQELTFGAEPYLPFHILVDVANQRRDTVFVDLPGEVMKPLVAHDLTDHSVARLSHSDGVVWVIDAAVMPPVQQALEASGRERILLESLRPGLFLPEWTRNLTTQEIRSALDEALAKSADRYPLTKDLGGVFARSTALLDANALRAVVLTKADIFPHLLADGRGWDFLRPSDSDVDQEEFASEFPAGGAEYLESLCANKLQPFDRAAEEVISWLRKSPTGRDKRNRCFDIARGVVTFYSDPARFKELVLKPERARVDDILHLIPCVTEDEMELELRVGSITADWEKYRSPGLRPLLMRDLVTAVLVRSILGTTSMADEIVAAEDYSPVRYFITGPMDAARQAKNPRINTATGKSPGVLHLLAWIMS